MPTRLILLALLLATGLGCRRSDSGREQAARPDTAAESPPASSDASAPAVVTPSNDSAAAAEVELATAMTQLTQVVRKYAMEQRRAPKSLEELVQHGYLDRLPQAPPGKTFAIDKQLQVYLANR